MVQVTNGSVKYGRTVKTGDFENVRVDVEFAFKLEDGEDESAAMDRVSAIAVAKALELVGLKKAKPAAIPVAPTTTAPNLTQPSDKDAKAAAITGGAPAAIVTEPKPARKAAVKPPKVDDTGIDVVGSQEPAATTSVADVGNDDDLFQASVPEITDAALLDKVKNENGRIGNPQAIRDITQKYVPFPKGVRDIPKELRAKYLADVAALPSKAK